jgi:hypothetical protein
MPLVGSRSGWKSGQSCSPVLRNQTLHVSLSQLLLCARRLIDIGYDNKNGNRRLAAPSQEVQRFATLFKIMLDLQVSQSHISFLEGQEEVMKVRVETLAQKAIALFIGVNGVLSSTDSSSARSRQPTSLQSGSYVLLSTQPTSRGQHSPSESRSTITRSYGASLDLSSTPTGGPYMHRRSASSPGPTYLDVQPIAVNHYLHDSMNHSYPIIVPTAPAMPSYPKMSMPWSGIISVIQNMSFLRTHSSQ